VNLAAAQLEEVYRARGRDLDERGQMALAFFESRPRLGIESYDAFLLEIRRASSRSPGVATRHTLPS